jgi:hypothetical protein
MEEFVVDGQSLRTLFPVGDAGYRTHPMGLWLCWSCVRAWEVRSTWYENEYHST